MAVEDPTFGSTVCLPADKRSSRPVIPSPRASQQRADARCSDGRRGGYSVLPGFRGRAIGRWRAGWASIATRFTAGFVTGPLDRDLDGAGLEQRLRRVGEVFGEEAMGPPRSSIASCVTAIAARAAASAIACDSTLSSGRRCTPPMPRARVPPAASGGGDGLRLVPSVDLSDSQSAKLSEFRPTLTLDVPFCGGRQLAPAGGGAGGKASGPLRPAEFWRHGGDVERPQDASPMDRTT